MISVDEALERIVGLAPVMPTETMALADAAGRVLAADTAARRTQPPFDASAMDGYAVRADDIVNAPVTLKIVGHAPAGNAFDGIVGAGEAVRIFTGGPVPKGANAVVLQEDTTAGAGDVTVNEPGGLGQHIRRSGIDFREGDRLLQEGRVLTPAVVGLLAAMGVSSLEVRCRPLVALIATGDELVPPGEPVGPNQIVSSNSVAIKALVERHGGSVLDLGIARDNEASLREAVERARGADILVTIGGASVGDHDIVKQVLGDLGLEIDFWKIAMRPGKPLIFGLMDNAMMLGLPGNPVSSMVCSLLFLVPLIRAMLGIRPVELPTEQALLGCELPANRDRQDYMRATLFRGDRRAMPVATPFRVQDSSMISLFANAGALVIRPPNAPAAHEGEMVEILPLDGI
ncbi:gephyrin-like molybdotransferase Glp [Emcibacter sp. SYSU 3D8]|uniref:molybdopterin molybdotransferase MoeA n=1 Tax=Emcibacter sp. SYSU 3D8 TaxID=3133969 RepID=UPI0031FEE154